MAVCRGICSRMQGGCSQERTGGVSLRRSMASVGRDAKTKLKGPKVMTTFEAVAYGALWGMITGVTVIIVIMIIKSMMPGADRNRRDDVRVLLSYLNAWDLTMSEIRKESRLSLVRANSSLIRLERDGLLESYGKAPLQRYALTNLGREAVFDLERDRIAAADNDRHGA